MAASPATIGLPDLVASVIRVGNGRGFVIAAGEERYVVTAAHCLNGRRAPADYCKVGKVGGKLRIWTKCKFADFIGHRP
jgi:hypothetical protein